MVPCDLPFATRNTKRETMRGFWIILGFVLCFSGCRDAVPPSANGNGDEGEAEGENGGALDSNACPTFDLTKLSSCCDLGAAHCVPASAYPEAAIDYAAACGDNGICVPDELLTGGDGYQAPACNSIGGEPGACLSVCVPEVQTYIALLPQDSCRKDQRCAPCIDPSNGESTRACDALTCASDAGESDAKEPAQEYSCENPPTNPLIDPTAFPPCCADAHCIPASIVPSEKTPFLAECEGGYCVPDRAAETGGYVAPASCESISQIEGRCFSTCLPGLEGQAESLPRSSCADSERCVPCCDPFTGLDTDACWTDCDSGPATACAGRPAFERCCDDASGYCVPRDLIPDEDEDGLLECSDRNVCLPNIFLDPKWIPSRCIGSLWIDEYDGVCLPECLDFGWAGYILDTADCPPSFICAPCADPLTGDPTGAPGC